MISFIFVKKRKEIILLCKLGYFHTTTWFRLYPCVLTISCTVDDHTKLHTCDPVSIRWIGNAVVTFQNRMCLSAVPPPLAGKPCWCDDLHTAFTAAVWSENLKRGPDSAWRPLWGCHTHRVCCRSLRMQAFVRWRTTSIHTSLARAQLTLQAIMGHNHDTSNYRNVV